MVEPLPDQLSGVRAVVRDVCREHGRIDCTHCHFYRLPHGPQIVAVALDETQARFTDG